MADTAQALLAELATTLGVERLEPDASGGVALEVGDQTVVLFAEDRATLLIVLPVMTLPAALDYGVVLWLLRRNFYDSPLAPFRVACDAAGTVQIWGRLPAAGASGASLTGLLQALADEAALIREEAEPANDGDEEPARG